MEEAKNGYDLKKIQAEILNKFENPEECLMLITGDKKVFIDEMLDYFLMLSGEKLGLMRDFPLKILGFFLKKAQELNSEIFLNPDHAKKVVFLLKNLEKEDFNEENLNNWPYINRSSSPEMQIIPFMNISLEILEIINRNYEEFKDIFWKKSSIYLSFFYRNSLFLSKNRQKASPGIIEKIKSLYDGVFKEKLGEFLIKPQEIKRNFNEMLIILMRCLILLDEGFLEQKDLINEDFAFCYETFICLSADFQSAKRSFEKKGVYVIF